MRTPSLAPALRRRASIAFGTAVLATVGVSTASADTVEVIVDGDVHDVRMYGGTVDDALDRLDVAIGAADEVTPAPRTPVEDGLTVDVARAISVDVEVEGSVARRVTAPVESVGEVLEMADVDEADDPLARIEPGLQAPVEDGDTISVEIPAELTVAVDGEELETSTFAPDIESALEELDVEVGPEDVVLPAETGTLVGLSTITVQRVEVQEETVEVVLDHDEVSRETSELERGETQVEQEGRDGLRVDTFEVTLVDGAEQDRERIAEEVVRDPRDRIVAIGTRPPPPPPPPTPAPQTSTSSSGVWDRLATCESHGNWSANTDNGYYGGVQFNPQTWRSVGGSGLPHQASKAEQIRRAEILQQRSGWGQWPACSRKLGLR